MLTFLGTKAIIIAKSESCDYPGISDSVNSILFLGTPHQGSTTAKYGEVLAQIANLFVIGTRTFRSRSIHLSLTPLMLSTLRAFL